MKNRCRWLSYLLGAALSASFAAAETEKLLFSPDTFLEHVKVLASDEWEGRRPDTEGAARAAEYIIRRFKAAGLEPAGVDGTWVQPFEIRHGKRIVEEQAALRFSDVDRAWHVGRDWTPLPFTTMEDVEGPLAFAGYGITAAEHDYDDYDNFDPSGKILLIFRYEPKADDAEADFGGRDPSRYATFVRKARTAHKLGAKALLIVNPPSRSVEDELYEFNTFFSLQTYHLPLVHVSRDLARAVLEQAGLPPLEELEQKLNTERAPLSQDLGLNCTLKIGVEPNTMTGRNVLGLLRGDGSTDETIVVGAHRDHLGKVARQFQRGDRTPVIHNGADDNASGTAALIELARSLGQGDKLRRHVLFIAFDAEEMGLIGSRHYVEEPTIPLERIKAMINFDMIGRLSQDKYTVFGTTTAREFPELVRRAAERVALEYKQPRSSGGSDHAPFVRKQIPAMFAFTGVHKQYHRPEDDWQLIDAEGAARILHMWHFALADLANMESGPEYTEPPAVTPEEEGIAVPKPAVEENQPVDSEAAAARDEDAAPKRVEMRVRLGIIPDMVGDDQVGMLIDTVLDSGPAKKAGMQNGDRITKIGGEEIRDIYGYMRALMRFKPGDETEIVVKRGEEEKTLHVTFERSQRRRGEE